MRSPRRLEASLSCGMDFLAKRRRWRPEAHYMGEYGRTASRPPALAADALEAERREPGRLRHQRMPIYSTPDNRRMDSMSTKDLPPGETAASPVQVTILPRNRDLGGFTVRRV